VFALLRNRDFGLLWSAALISFIGAFAFVIAMPLHVYRLTDSTAATALVLAASTLPRVIFGSVAGVFVDRWDRKRTMVICDISRAVILLPIVVAPDELAVLIPVALAQGMIGLFFTPAEGALLPRLVGAQHLVQANALNALNDNLAMLIGPALGAVLYAQVGIAGAVLVNVGSYAISGLLISLIAADARPERHNRAASESGSTGSAMRGVVDELRAGFAVVREKLALRVLFTGMMFNNLADGIFLTLGLSPLVLDVLGGTPEQVGWFASVQAVGGFVAGIVIVRFARRISTRWLFGGGLIGLGLADGGAANSRLIAAAGTPAVTVGMGWMVFAGFPAVGSGTGRQSIVQEETSDAFRGRVFGALSSVGSVALLGGLALGGILGDRVGIVPMLTFAALIRIFGGIIALVFLPEPTRAPTHTFVPAAEADGP
jgi:MFS family permease